MTEPGMPGTVREYLASLEHALADLPAETSRDIIGAIREELYGLDAASAAERIRRFGDPQFIASEARAAGARSAPAMNEANTGSPQGGLRTSTLAAPAMPVAAVALAPRTPRWFSGVILVVMLFGGLVLPVLGTLVGFVMMWCSTAWTRTEKWIATLAPVLTYLALYLASVAQRSILGPGEMARFHREPLIPQSILVDTVGMYIQAAVLTAVCAALLCRAVTRRDNTEGRVV